MYILTRSGGNKLKFSQSYHKSFTEILHFIRDLFEEQ